MGNITLIFQRASKEGEKTLDGNVKRQIPMFAKKGLDEIPDKKILQMTVSNNIGNYVKTNFNKSPNKKVLIEHGEWEVNIRDYSRLRGSIKLGYI